MHPCIRKAKQVAGASILLRNVLVGDSEFILSLRLDPRKARYLSPTSARLADQVAWLRGYEQSDDQAYFIVCDKHGQRLGCVRMHDAFESSYWWGSWLMVGGLSPLIALESALLVYAYGKYLDFRHARIRVRKYNTSVWKFHERVFSAERVGETEMDYLYVLNENGIDASLKRYAHLITTPLLVSGFAPDGCGA